MKKPKGVITVTFTLILLVILSVLTTAIESARVAAGRFIIENAVRMSSEAVLADYNALLFGRYHVFGRNTAVPGEAGRTFLETKLQTMLEKNTPDEGSFLWKYETVETQITDCVRLTDYNGAFFRQQAVEYMEYRSAAEITETLFEALNLFDKADDALEILNYENEARQALVKIDMSVLSLMENVDGIRTDNDGIKQNFFGKIKTADDFVKKILQEKPTMASAKVNRSELFAALEKQYTDPNELLDDMFDALLRYEKIESEIAEILLEEKELEAWSENGTDAEKAAVFARKALLEAQRLALEAKKLIPKAEISTLKNKLKKLFEGSKTACEQALEIMNEISRRQSEAEPKILVYAEQLAQTAGKIDLGLYNSLQDGLDEMRKYLGQKVEGFERIPNFEGMRETLEKDKTILEDALSILELLDFSADKTQSEQKPIDTLRVSELRECLSGYNFENLWFDYSGIQLKESGLNPIQTVKNVMEEGLAAMVLPAGTSVSEKEIQGDYLPGSIIGLTADDEDGINANIDSTSLFSVFKESPLSAVKELLLDGADSVAEKAMYLAYLSDHFGSFTQNGLLKETDVLSDSSDSGSDRALNYELEYILCGNATDRENLNAVITRILLVRTAFCLIHVLSDSDKCAKAKVFATGILGFTGMPVLVELMKYIVLFVWAFDEGLVETAAIMQGKKVAMIPDKTSFQVDFAEIAIMSPALIEAKVQSRTDAVSFGLDYNSYLLLFLLLENEETQNMRTMDMIQENLRLRDDDFRMASMVYGFNSETTVSLPALFGGMQFSSMKQAKGFLCKVKNGVRY